MRKIPGSRRKKTKDARILLDEEWMTNVNRENFGNEKGRRGILLFIDSEIWHLK